VPQPALPIPLCVNATGSLELSGRWPAGLPQWTTAWMQAWLPNPDALQGWLASNGLSATQLAP